MSPITSGVSRHSIDWHPYKKVAKNSGSDLVETIESYYDTHVIRIPFGDYTVDEEINFTVADNTHPKFIGDGSEGVIIRSSEAKVFHAAPGTFSGGGTTQKCTISGMEIKHTTDAATDVSLDLLGCQANLNDVQLTMASGGTRQGIGVLCGSGDDTSPSGSPSQWHAVNTYRYGTGFDVGLDHLSMYDCMVYGCANYGFRIRDTWPGSEGSNYAHWIALFHPQINGDGQHATMYPFHFTKP